ncbi:rho gtpase activating protein 11a [Holotrichia oblita]|uniref:Rho gtpase activating protein 11a n=1 Tax=Holotrichia oblita TaxID=644536 RepID=A0ACB9TLD3_HOLOL|nr:rho gtpase activating protein 11a [Holotrichia oblita]
MFLNDVNKKEEIKNLALQDLRSVGIKFRLKKSKQNVQDLKSRKAFKTPLSSLTTQTVTLPSGQQLIIPKLVHELCSFILTKVHTEGLFRKGGSKSRQNEIRFLYQVTEYSMLNKMDAYNLAVVIGPTLLPIEEKLAPHATHRLTKICELFKLLVENASAIGVVPESIIERIALSSSSTSLTDEDSLSLKKKKKRRSGSLTRMFNGLKKIVSSKPPEEIPAITPDLLMTPCATRSAKNENLKTLVSQLEKKKKILNKLPQNAALSTPYTPVSVNPNPKRKTPESCPKTVPTKEGSDDASVASSKTSVNSKSLLERRWSQVSSQMVTFRKNKKRILYAISTAGPSKKKEILNKLPQNAALSTPYTPVSVNPKVTEIERRISIELENPNVNLNKQLNTIENVQDAYEQTLEQAKPLSPTTDQLARRLSRELKIRRSAEQKIIRSPSARKIGSIRRRSRELEKQTNTTKQNWYVSELNATPKASINRRKSNVSCKLVNVNNEASYENVESLKKVTTRSSFHGESIITKPKPQIRRYSNCTTNSDKWQNADGFFRGSLTPRNSGENGRASLARLRSQNAGMVMAKAKLFDGLVSSDNSSSKDTPVLIPRVRSNKMGSIRNVDRQSYRIRTLKTEDRKVLKKNISPRKRTCKSPNISRQQRLQPVKNTNLALILRDSDLGENKENKNNINNHLRNKIIKDSINSSSSCVTPKSIPHIKRPFAVKSPKRLMRTPLSTESRTTPLKVIGTTRQNY